MISVLTAEAEIAADESKAGTVAEGIARRTEGVGRGAGMMARGLPEVGRESATAWVGG